MEVRREEVWKVTGKREMLFFRGSPVLVKVKIAVD